MRIIDTYRDIPTAFEGGQFSPARWRDYIDAAIPDLRPLLEADAKEMLSAGGVSWETDFLPVFNALDEIISFDIGDVKRLYGMFMEQGCSSDENGR